MSALSFLAAAVYLLTVAIAQTPGGCGDADIPEGATVEKSPGYFCDDSSVYCGTAWAGFPMACEAGVCADDAEGAAGTVCSASGACADGLVCEAASDGVRRCLSPRRHEQSCNDVGFVGGPPLVFFDRCEPPYECNEFSHNCVSIVEKGVGDLRKGRRLR